MWNQANVMIIGALVFLAAIIVAFLRHRDGQRIAFTEGQVKDYLISRFGILPAPLSIQSSHDALWPVLVRFTDLASNKKFRFQFGASGASPLRVVSERIEI